MSKNIFQDAALYLAASTGALYFLGRINHAAYLKTLGLNLSLFPKETTDYIVMAFSKYFFVASIGIFCILSLPTVFGFLWHFISLLLTFIIRKISYKTYKGLVTVRNYWAFEMQLLKKPYVRKRRELISDNLFNSAFVFVLFAMVVLLYAWQGKDSAEETLKKLETDLLQTYTITKDMKEYKFSILTCSSITKLCAIYVYDDKNQFEILKLEKLDGAKVLPLPKMV